MASLIILSHSSPLTSLNSSFSICEICLALNTGISPGLCTWSSIPNHISFWAISTISAISTTTYMHDFQFSLLFTFSSKLQTLRNIAYRSSLVVQWVKDLVLPREWLGLLLWHGFDPRPGNFCMLWVQQKTKNPPYRRSFRCPTGNFKSQVPKGIYYLPQTVPSTEYHYKCPILQGRDLRKMLHSSLTIMPHK